MSDGDVVQQRLAKLIGGSDDGGAEVATARCAKMLADIRSKESDLASAAEQLRANYDGTTRDWTGNGANG